MYFLQHVALGDFDIRNVPKTQALLEQKSLTRGQVDALVENLAHDGQLPCGHHKYPDVAVTSGEKSNEGFWPWVRLQHRDLTTWTPSGILTVLRKDWGCERFMRNGVLGIKFPLINSNCGLPSIKSTARRNGVPSPPHGFPKWDRPATESTEFHFER